MAAASKNASPAQQYVADGAWLPPAAPPPRATTTTAAGAGAALTLAGQPGLLAAHDLALKGLLEAPAARQVAPRQVAPTSLAPLALRPLPAPPPASLPTLRAPPSPAAPSMPSSSSGPAPDAIYTSTLVPRPASPSSPRSFHDTTTRARAGSTAVSAGPTTTAPAVVVYSGAGNLWAGHCATASWTLVDGGESMLLAPFVGCINPRPECCPFAVAANDTGAGASAAKSSAFPHPQPDDALRRCPTGYASVDSGGCCPSGFAPWTAAIGGETPCYSALQSTVSLLHVDETATLQAHLVATNSAGSTTPVMTNAVFAMQLEVRSPSGGLSAGAIAGIVVGAVVGVALILAAAGFLFWRRRRRAQRQVRDQARGLDRPDFYGLDAATSPSSPGMSMVDKSLSGRGLGHGANGAELPLPPTTASTLHGSTPVLVLGGAKDMKADQRSRADSSDTAGSSRTATTATSERAKAAHHSAYASQGHWAIHEEYGHEGFHKGSQDRSSEGLEQHKTGHGEQQHAVGGGSREEGQDQGEGDLTRVDEEEVEDERPESFVEVASATIAPPAPAPASAAVVRSPTTRSQVPSEAEEVQTAKPQRLSRGFAKLVYTTSPLPSPGSPCGGGEHMLTRRGTSPLPSPADSGLGGDNPLTRRGTSPLPSPTSPTAPSAFGAMEKGTEKSG